MFTKISKSVGTMLENGDIVRHPLAYLLEAADDIAYATADLEDAVKKGIINLEQFVKLFYEILGAESKNERSKIAYPRELLTNLEKAVENGHKNKHSDSEIIKPWIANVRRWLIYVAIFGFGRDYAAIMDGVFGQELLHDTYHTKTMAAFSKAMRDYVYNDPSILRIELASQVILSSLLDKFIPAVINYDTATEMSIANKKLFNLLPKNYVDDYHSASKSYGKDDSDIFRLYLRLLMVTDFVSGMTDTYASTLYRELSGIEV